LLSNDDVYGVKWTQKGWSKFNDDEVTLLSNDDVYGAKRTRKGWSKFNDDVILCHIRQNNAVIVV
jgi:hypothetical protein